MQWLDVLSRIVHVATAITLVGGTAFLRLVLIPIAERLPEESHKQLSAAIQTRWKRFVHAGILLFLLSGFYNYMRAIPLHKGDGLYHALIGTKILLALAVFFLASALVGRSPAFDSLRQAKRRWLAILLGLALAIVCISGYLKVRGVPATAPTAVADDLGQQATRTP
ncbi:MAG: hypothetical protein D6753_07415 [Planctomycetota bacterium]|nr:MAG: hypothetical protein D6753_07415 [Planctomycetota bacterium]